MRIALPAALAVVLLGGTAAYGWRIYRAPGPLARPSDIVVPHGGLGLVGESLAASGVVRSARAFRLAAMATAAYGPLRAAELRFPANASLAVVLDVLRNARPVQHRVTIAEGLEAAQIAQTLARQGALLDGDLVVPDEAALLPETYVFERGTKMPALMARAQAAMRRALAEAWAGRAPGLPLTTPREAVILASIVEHEARLAAERPMIARVFLNRLMAGMRLQADPTVSYGVEGGLGVLTRRLDRDDLARVDFYNTYVVAGLPAGPICSPGLASLKAVLHPAAGDALYFVADGTGGHSFAATLSAHNGNVARYRGLVERARPAR
jgi:UPF0755 protein